MCVVMVGQSELESSPNRRHSQWVGLGDQAHVRNTDVMISKEIQHKEKKVRNTRDQNQGIQSES